MDENNNAILSRFPSPPRHFVQTSGDDFDGAGDSFAEISDGGDGGDPQNNAQNLNVLFGKMLRIDVGTTTGYVIPGSNRWATNARGSRGSGTRQWAGG